MSAGTIYEIPPLPPDFPTWCALYRHVVRQNPNIMYDNDYVVEMHYRVDESIGPSGISSIVDFKELRISVRDIKLLAFTEMEVIIPNSNYLREFYSHIRHLTFREMSPDTYAPMMQFLEQLIDLA